jgi:uncharacterized protein YggU (UPF0235/DUF167 family)
LIARDEFEARLRYLGPALRQEKEGTVLAVTVIPHAPHNAVAGFRNGSLLVKVSAAPEKGRANEAVLELIAEFLGTAPSKLRLLRGQTSRNKLVLLQNMG